MRGNVYVCFADRRKAADAAKAARAQTFKVAKDTNAPLLEAGRLARVAVANAREARRLEREQAHHDESVRLAAERSAAEAAEAALEQAQVSEQANSSAVDQAAQKARRDLRYAMRKSRQK